MQDNNPFKVKSPEKITAEETISLFVNVFNDFPDILIHGDSFINGPRGSGKSMMFRYMLPDAQVIKQDCNYSELSYFSTYIPIKATDFDKVELYRLKEQAQKVINEHILSTHIAVMFFSDLLKYKVEFSDDDFETLKAFLKIEFKRMLRKVGYKNFQDIDFKSVDELLVALLDVCEEMHYEASDYCDRIGFQNEGISPYMGSLCSYLHFLHPLLTKFSQLHSIPSYLYILIDDADNLNTTQKQVLNSWVYYRLGTNISLKISTQMRYNVYLTLSGQTIDSPHDYSEVNISNVYTSSKNKYKELIHDIVQRRLVEFKLPNTNPNDFFPEYKKQEEAINKIYKYYIKQFEEGKSRGSKKFDDANRYSRPDYIKELKSSSKQGSSYFYSGFNQLIHLSSGIVRYFLESSTYMYSEMLKNSTKKEIEFISPTVQNKVSRAYSNEFLFEEFEKHKKTAKLRGYSSDNIRYLRNLIDALGGLFSAILLSNASERRVFSVAISNEPDELITEVFELGVGLGYFQISTIGNKEGTGRTRLYVMNRRLAPVFTLDPTSFAGYKFLRNEELKLAILDPQNFIRSMKKKLSLNVEEDLYVNDQLELFEE